MRQIAPNVLPHMYMNVQFDVCNTNISGVVHINVARRTNIATK